MDNASTFQFSVGKEFPLPTGFDISDALRQDTLTPKIIAMYREEGSQNCHFFRTLEMMASTERVGLFVPDGVKPGDVIRIMWVDNKCACGIPVEFINPGRKFLAWLHATDSSGDLAKLKMPDLIDLVKRQTELIPIVGLQPGCAIVIPKLDIYDCHWKTGRKASGAVIVTGIDWEVSREKKNDVSFAERFGRQPGYVRIGEGGYTPADEDAIIELVDTCHAKKWSM